MKKLLFIFCLALSISSVNAQKVAFAGFNYATSPNEGGFSVLAIEDLSAGEVFYFTENEYDDANNSFNDISEVVLKITVTATISKGDVIYVKETAPNTFSSTLSAGSGSVNLTYINASGNFSNFKSGEIVYLYKDTNDDPSDGVTEIYAALYPGTFSASSPNTGGPIPANQNPVSDYPNAIVVENFPVFDHSIEPYKTTGVARVEYKTSVANRTDVNKVKLENASNYVFAGAHQDLSTQKFTNFNLAGTKPAITLAVNTTELDENSSSNFTFTFTASEAPSSDLIVNFSINDGVTLPTATFGSDFTQTGASAMNTTSGSVVISSGTTSKTITINPTGDTTLEPDETLKIDLSNSSDYDAGSPSTQTVLIKNDDTQTVVPEVAVCGIRPYSGTEDDISEFAFVILKEISAGSSYVFSSNTFDKDVLQFTDVSTRPSELKWTVASSGASRGDVIVVKKTASNTFTVTKNGSTTNAGSVSKLSPSKKFFISEFFGLFTAHTDADDNPYNGITNIQSVIFNRNLGVFGGNIPSDKDVSTLYLGSILVDGFPNTSPRKFEYKPTLRPSTTIDQANFENPSNWNYGETLADLSPTPFNNIIISEGAVNPKVSLTVNTTDITEDTETATFTFTLDAVATSDVTINFSVAGSAVFSSDYTVSGASNFTASTGSVVIANGTSSAQITINPVTDTDLETKENVLVTIISGTGYDGGSPSSASVNIVNDDANTNPSKIAIIGINHESPSSVSLVAVSDLAPQETFYMLRNQFDKETLTFQSGGKYVFTTPNACITKGTVFTITGNLNGPLTVNCTNVDASDCGTATIEGSGNVFDFLDIGTRYHIYEDDDDDQTNGITQIHSVFHTGGTYPALHTGGTLTPEENPKSVYANAVVVDNFPNTNPNRTEFDSSKRGATVTKALLEDTANYLHGQTNATLSVTNFNRNSASVIYVNASASSGGNGTSWATAYNKLQDALSVATDCSQIWVASGTYKPVSQSATILISSGIKLYGGFAGTETLLSERNWNANQTILSGDLNSNNTTDSSDAQTVVRISADDVILDGFIIEYGHADSTSLAGRYGAGIFIRNDANPQPNNASISNCIIRKNTASGRGLSTGGGVSIYGNNHTFTNCLFYDNFATNEGGAIALRVGKNMKIINCTFENNQVAEEGGAVHIHTANSGGSVEISNSIFENNISITNSANRDIFNHTAGNVLNVTNCLFDGNFPFSGGGETINNIAGNITNNNANFVDLSVENYNLQLNSQAINTGNSALNTFDIDLAGNPRITSTMDMGAFEYDTEITEWLGSENTNWNNINNWVNGVPSATKSALIRGGVLNEPVVNTTATVKDIFIDNFVTFSINSNQSLTVDRNLIQNGTFIINSDATNSGSLIIGGSFSGTQNLQYNRFVSTSANATEGWYLLSSPLVGQAINGFKNDVLTSGNKFAIATYNNAVASDRYEYYTDNTGTNDIDNAGNFISAKGYSVKRTTAGTFNFTGTPNTDDISIAITDNSSAVGNKWNLVGNPFTSAININADANATHNFLTVNASKMHPSRVAIYQWNATTASYDIYNQATGSARYIAPGQGFFVNAVDGGETLTFTEAMQTHQTGNIFSKNSNEIPEIELLISDNTITQKTIIKYLENTTTGLDKGYDAGMFSTGSAIEIFTHLVSESTGEDFALQCLPNKDLEAMIIPIGITIDANKNGTISAEVLHIPSGVELYLEDKENNTFTNLNSNNYSFVTTSALNGIGRFYLHTSAAVLSADDEFISNNISIYQTSKENLRIVGIQNGTAKISLLDILGKQILATSFEANGSNDVLLSNLKAGVYIVDLQTGNGKINRKVIIE